MQLARVWRLQKQAMQLGADAECWECSGAQAMRHVVQMEPARRSAALCVERDAAECEFRLAALDAAAGC